MEQKNFVLPSSPVFSTLSSSAGEIRLRAGETLVRAGAPLIGIIAVKKGRLKRSRTFGSQEFLAGLAAPGESLGLDEVLKNETIHRETLEAIGETIVTVEPLEKVSAWLQATPAALLQAIRGAREKDVRAETFLKRPLELMPVRARVAATLWILAERHSEFDADASARVLDLNLTREEVAHLAGTVYESVIRTLTSLKKEGVIDLQGRIIRILNEDQLARIGQIVVVDLHDQNTVAQNHSSSNNSSPQEAC